MKIGDKVRFLSEVGGGKITGFQGKDIVLVEDADGFDIPVTRREIVVIDTDDYNIEHIQPKQKEDVPQKSKQNKVQTSSSDEDEEDIEFEAPAVELKGGDVLNVYLAYVPEDVKMINATTFNTYLVNDSNYYLEYLYLSGENNAWKVRSKGEIAPNMKGWLESFMQSDLNELEHICIQFTAYKKDKSFELHAATDVTIHLDTVKFYKMHCFGDSDFFEESAMVYDIVKNNVPYKQYRIDADNLQKEMMRKKHIDEQQPARINQPKHKNKEEKPVIDLHIGELLDTTAGLSNGEMLNIQLDKFREEMKLYEGKHGQHIVFIHGKGNGVLRNAILKELKTKYNNSCHWQDASFQEYGFGATEVIMR